MRGPGDWESRYASVEGSLFGDNPAVVLTQNPGWFQPGQTALCVADGEGRNSVWLAARGLKVTAFDPSPTAVDRARARAAASGAEVDFQIADWSRFEWAAGRWDRVVAIFIQYATPEERKSQFADLKAAVRPGGTLVLHGYTPAQIANGTGGPRDPAHLYSSEMLREVFADWQIERLAEYECELDEGTGHSGRSALIDLIATKP